MNDAMGMGLKHRGFSLIELVIVVVIIGIIGAIAVPRVSRGAVGAAESALAQDLHILRSAVALYQAEHNGQQPLDAKVTEQLLGYTDIDGNVSPDGTMTTPYIYGPYLGQLPKLPIGTRKGNTGIHWTDGAGVGWLYSQAAITMKAHASGEFDSRGREYSDY